MARRIIKGLGLVMLIPTLLVIGVSGQVRE